MGKNQSEHINEFYKLVGDLAGIDIAILDEDHTLLLLTSLPSYYDNFMESLLYGRDTLKLENVLMTLNSRKLQKMTEAKSDGGKGFYVRWRSGKKDMKQGTYSSGSKSQQVLYMYEDQVPSSEADEYDNANVMMAMSIKALLYWIMDSGGSYHMTYKRDYLFDFKEYDGGNVPFGDERECRAVETPLQFLVMTSKSSREDARTFIEDVKVAD
uniref:Retrovirus-related Pol polyprotein from transposon TNT 1-94-like beta-barrel domain-containing protein n=1 Tax=Tanacetum cinerariifolium TaxID=118510 RepID=A0A699II31_TANCI|nr:hypothetical protein [Tanacetum cinerariifolium]